MKSNHALNGQDEFWSSLTKTALALAACGVAMFVLLLVSRALAALILPVIGIVMVVGARRAQRAWTHYTRRRDERPLNWKQKLLADPSIDLWRNHPFFAIAVTLFALATTVAMLFVRWHH